MSPKKGLLILGVLIALLCIPTTVVATGSGDVGYVGVTLDPAYEYGNLTIKNIYINEPFDPTSILIKLEKSDGSSKIIQLPSIGNVTRVFEDNLSSTYDGREITVTASPPKATGTLPEQYQSYLIYTEKTFPRFEIEASGGQGNVLMIKRPENVDDLDASFTNILKAMTKEGYLFADAGIIYYNGSEFKTGGSIDNYTGDLNSTLARNVVSLSGFKPNETAISSVTEKGHKLPQPGEYLITVVQYDSASKTMHVLAAMPVLILNGDTTVNADSTYYKSEGGTVSFNVNGVNRIAYALVKRDATYNLSVTLEPGKLAGQSVPTSPISALNILKSITGDEVPFNVTLSLDNEILNVTYNRGSNFAIVEGYGCSGYANAPTVTIQPETLQGLNEGTYYLYALGMDGQKVVAVDQKEVDIKADRPTPTPGGGGGGGSSSSKAPASYTSTGTLLTSSAGTVLKSIKVNAEDNVGSLFIPTGTKALDANGNPLTEVGIEPLASDAVPAVPAGAVFAFAGYAYVASPAGATFDPAITLTLEIPEDVWNTLDLESEQLSVKWYNEETGLWEDVPTTFDPETRTVRATVTHFSIFALFTEPVPETTTPTETPTTTTTTTTTAPAASAETPTEGLPVTMILGIFVVVIIIAAAGYFLLKRK